jgi:hypothetical protein
MCRGRTAAGLLRTLREGGARRPDPAPSPNWAKLGYGPEPVPGIAHRIAIPAHAATPNPLSRPGALHAHVTRAHAAWVVG